MTQTVHTLYPVFCAVAAAIIAYKAVEFKQKLFAREDFLSMGNMGAAMRKNTVGKGVQPLPKPSAAR